MTITGYSLIGQNSSGHGTTTFTALNPATQEALEPIFHEATAAEIDKAIAKAELAFPVYKSCSPELRARFLEAIADEILALGDALVQRAMAETALPEGRIIGERGRTMNQLRLFAEVVREGSWVDARIDPALPDRQPPRPDIRQMQVPLGPAGIFGASNFPLAFSVAGGDTASALAAGCPVVVKAHPMHPGTSELVGQAILAAATRTGMPDGVFSLLQGPSVKVGMAIVTHPKITAIGFTGSFRGGKAIFDAANQRPVPIPVFAEMGSQNPVFILPGALASQSADIAKGLTGSVTLGVGQFCTNPGLVVTGKADASDEFLRQLQQEIETAVPGTMLGDSIRAGYDAGVNALARENNVKQVASSQSPADGNAARAHVFATDGATYLANPVLREEVFGPATLAVSTHDKADMLRLASGLDGHLTATILGTEEDLAEYGDLIAILERKVGRIIVNGYPTGVEVCHAMVHGGPFPATTASQSTSVGTAAIRRFSRPVCYQNFPAAALPAALQDGNPLGIWRMVEGEMSKE